MAKLELERQPIAGVIFVLNVVARTTKKENGNVKNGWKSGDYSVSLIHQFFSCTRQGVKTEHFVVSTERDTDAQIVFRCMHSSSNAHAFGSRTRGLSFVSCLSVLESQFHSLRPMVITFPTQTSDSLPSLLNPSTSPRPRVSPQT